MLEDAETVVVEGDIVEGSEAGAGDAALAYEQGLAVGALAENVAEQAEQLEQVQSTQGMEQAQWESLSQSIQSLDQRLAGLENRMIEQQMETQAVIEEVLEEEEATGAQEGGPTLEVTVPEPTTNPETEQGSAGSGQPQRRRKKAYRLP